MSKNKPLACQCRTCEHFRVVIKSHAFSQLEGMKLKYSHTIDIVVRTDGIERHYDGGFLKLLLN